MFDCKVCVHNQVCKNIDKSEIFKRALDTLKNQFDLVEPFEVDPVCKHYANPLNSLTSGLLKKSSSKI